MREQMSLATIATRRLELVPRSAVETRAAIESLSPEEKREMSPIWLAMVRDADVSNPWIHGFTIRLRGEPSVVGEGGFKGPPDAEGVVEIAYAIAPEHRGRGYATESAAALVAWALRDPSVLTVRAHTLREPNASTHVLAKCGFRKTGEVDDPEDGPVWRWEKFRSESGFAGR